MRQNPCHEASDCPQVIEAGLRAKRNQKLDGEIVEYARANAGSRADLDSVLEEAGIGFLRDGQPDLEGDAGSPD